MGFEEDGWAERGSFVFEAEVEEACRGVSCGCCQGLLLIVENLLHIPLPAPPPFVPFSFSGFFAVGVVDQPFSEVVVE